LPRFYVDGQYSRVIFVATYGRARALIAKHLGAHRDRRLGNGQALKMPLNYQRTEAFLMCSGEFGGFKI
jgi:hypothetical protein